LVDNPEPINLKKDECDEIFDREDETKNKNTLLDAQKQQPQLKEVKNSENKEDILITNLANKIVLPYT
jgi:hypothetical protein